MSAKVCLRALSSMAARVGEWDRGMMSMWQANFNSGANVVAVVSGPLAVAI